MIFARWLRGLVPVFLSLLLFVTACSKAPSRYADVQKETSGRNAPAAVAKAAEQGAKFNRFFPDPTGSYEVVPTQEKKGFAEYKLNQDGKTVAMLSISDTSSVPTAAAKYQDSTEKLAGYPLVDQGMNGTGILVNDRYQVKVLSRDPEFTKDDRLVWIQKFDLRGLAKLEPATNKSAKTGAVDRTAKPVPVTAKPLTAPVIGRDEPVSAKIPVLNSGKTQVEPKAKGIVEKALEAVKAPANEVELPKLKQPPVLPPILSPQPAS